MQTSASPSKVPAAEADYDELDEFNSDDDDPNVFKIRDSLEQASGVTYTTKRLHGSLCFDVSLDGRLNRSRIELIHDGVVDLNPPYQRGRYRVGKSLTLFSHLPSEVVWPETKQIGLIDSIFRNFWVPPIVFTVQQDDDGEETRICVDGKQVCNLDYEVLGSSPRRP
jgi:hypothetical protein